MPNSTDAAQAYMARVVQLTEDGTSPLEAIRTLEREHQCRLVMGAMHALGRNYLPQAVHAIAPLLLRWGLSDKDYWGLVRDAWTGCEWPLQWLHPKSWLTLFRHGSHDLLMTPEEQALLDEQASVFTVYRGVAGMAGRTWRRKPHWSWTLEKDRAIWFAKRLGGETPMLLTQRVDRQDVFALLDSRSEKEILTPFMHIDPDYVVVTHL
jgi:hypothetical protein